MRLIVFNTSCPIKVGRHIDRAPAIIAHRSIDFIAGTLIVTANRFLTIRIQEFVIRRKVRDRILPMNPELSVKIILLIFIIARFHKRLDTVPTL